MTNVGPQLFVLVMSRLWYQVHPQYTNIVQQTSKMHVLNRDKCIPTQSYCLMNDLGDCWKCYVLSKWRLLTPIFNLFDDFKVLNLDAMDKSRHWKIVGCSAYTGDGLLEGFDWLVQDIASRIYVLD